VRIKLCSRYKEGARIVSRSHAPRKEKVLDSLIGRMRIRPLWVSVALALLLCGFALLASLPAPAEAAKGGTCASFSVTTGGNTFRGDQTRTIRAGQVGDRIFVDGRYIEFSVRSSDFAVLNYRHTGVDSPRADKNLPIGPAGTTIFESKVPLHGKTLTSPVSLSLGNESVVLERSGGGQDMKIQAKDCQQGGLFQMEPEPGTTERNTLGPDFTYTSQPPGEERLCFTNGRFAGYDSPELATLVSNTEKVATWQVGSGGRIGMVIGEDALEGGCSP
jgi:hypothetical protein